MGNSGSIVVRARPSLFLLFESLLWVFPNSQMCTNVRLRRRETSAKQVNELDFISAKFLLFLSVSPNKDGSWYILWWWFSLSTWLSELWPQAAGFLQLETENNESVCKESCPRWLLKLFTLNCAFQLHYGKCWTQCGLNTHWKTESLNISYSASFDIDFLFSLMFIEVQRTPKNQENLSKMGLFLAVFSPNKNETKRILFSRQV